MQFVSQNDLLLYLRKILSRFSGYLFISISKARKQDDKNAVLVAVHHSLPIQDENGCYNSDKDVAVCVKYTENADFEGLIMDRNMNYAFGNPFKQPEKNDNTELPTIGKEKVPFDTEDESVVPL